MGKQKSIKSFNLINKNSDLFEQFMEKIPAVIGLHDDEDCIVYLNSGANSFLLKNSAVGLPISEIVSKESADKVAKLLQEARKNGYANSIIETTNFQTNEKHTFKAIAFTIEDKNKNVHVGTVYVDITKQQHDNHEILKQRYILNNSPISIAVTDLNGVIEYANPYFCKTSGYSIRDVIGKNSRILKSDFHPKEDYRILWETISSGKTWSGIFKNIKKNGESYWESAIIAPVKSENKEIKNYIAVKQEITEQVYLKKKILEQEDIMSQNFEKTLEAFVSIVEDRDSYTGGHSQRVAAYSKMIAKEMGCSEDECELIYKAGTLHDIGKISTPDNVLLKPDRLSELEYKLIKRHVEVSHTILSTIPMYKDIADIVICHHERYDGRGYPKGLCADEIPLLGHIMIVADAFDAMTTNRIYKAKKSVDEAIVELQELSEKQFHPKVVSAAAKVLKSIEVIDDINQLPITELEKERFAYFYRDQITDAYNSKYLNYVLNQNSINQEFICVNIIYMHNFSKYNEKHGWAEGDKFLKKFADSVIEKFSPSFVFRIHGDDFVVISKSHNEVVIDELTQLELFDKSEISLSYKHVDLRINNINNLNELEMLILKHS